MLRGSDGGAIFTVNDDRKARTALRCGFCPICGEALGRWKWFVGGPRSAFDAHGWYLDLPGHHECIRFALATCPYLAAPRYLGRIDVPDPSKLPLEASVLIDHTMIPERPELFVAVASSRIEVQWRDGLLAPYVRPTARRWLTNSGATGPTNPGAPCDADPARRLRERVEHPGSGGAVRIPVGGGGYIEPDEGPRNSPYHMKNYDDPKYSQHARSGHHLRLECGHEVQTFGDLSHCGGVILCTTCRDARQ